MKKKIKWTWIYKFDSITIFINIFIVCNRYNNNNINVYSKTIKLLKFLHNLLTTLSRTSNSTWFVLVWNSD